MTVTGVLGAIVFGLFVGGVYCLGHDWLEKRAKNAKDKKRLGSGNDTTEYMSFH